MERSGENIHLFTQSYESTRRIEISLATKLGLSNLKAGNIVIRDERGWRQNEKYIDHVWIVYIDRSFVGWCGIFPVRAVPKLRDVICACIFIKSSLANFLS